MRLVFTISGTILAWAAVLGVLFLLRDVPRALFVITHYILNISLFGVLAYLLRKAGVSYSAGNMMMLITGSLLALELVYWKWINIADAARYLNGIEWVVPLILVMGTVYIVALFSK